MSKPVSQKPPGAEPLPELPPDKRPLSKETLKTARSALAIFLSQVYEAIRSFGTRVFTWLHSTSSKAYHVFQSVFGAKVLPQPSKREAVIETLSSSSTSNSQRLSLETWVLPNKAEWDANIQSHTQFERDANRQKLIIDKSVQRRNFKAKDKALAAFLEKKFKNKDDLIRFQIENLLTQHSHQSDFVKSYMQQYIDKGEYLRDEKSKDLVFSLTSSTHLLFISSTAYWQVREISNPEKAASGYDATRFIIIINMNKALPPDGILSPGCASIREEFHGKCASLDEISFQT